jgi:hypothetical protein
VKAIPPFTHRLSWVIVAPLTLLPWSVGIAVWLVVSVLAATGALWLLGVRDSRVYAVALGSGPLLIGFIFGNVTLLLLFGLAAAWHWRDRPSISAPVVAALIVAKIFLWPLPIWLLVTRRVRALAYVVGYAVLAAGCAPKVGDQSSIRGNLCDDMPD